MKTIYVTALLSLLSILYVNGQPKTLTVDAGRDTCVCSYSETVLGGNPTVQGGTPPYTYCWYGVYEIWPGLLYEYASYFLNDTTLANPSIIGAQTYFDSYIIHLVVTDATGNQGWDSVLVCSPHYGCLGWNPDATITQGDSVMLYEACFGGIEPHTYLWDPPDGLTDPTNLNTYASPEQSTWYYLDMWDSCGCSLVLTTGPSLFHVRVIPVGTDLNDWKEKNYAIVPNPNRGVFQVQSTHGNEKIDIRVVNSLGVKVSDLVIVTNETISMNTLDPGLYFLHLRSDKQTRIMKMIIQ